MQLPADLFYHSNLNMLQPTGLPWTSYLNLLGPTIQKDTRS